MRMDIKKAGRIFLLTLIIATFLFIFTQSMLPKEQSKEQSDKVGEIVEEVIPPTTDVGNFVHINLRKIAHFIEFSLLGAELAIYVLIYVKKVTRGTVIYAIGLAAAFTDEGIQLFSDRGASIRDVALDFCGFVISATLIFGVWYLCSAIIKRKKCK